MGVIHIKKIFDKYLSDYPENLNYTSVSIFFDAISELVIDELLLSILEEKQTLKIYDSKIYFW